MCYVKLTNTSKFHTFGAHSEQIVNTFCLTVSLVFAGLRKKFTTKFRLIRSHVEPNLKLQPLQCSIALITFNARVCVTVTNDWMVKTYLSPLDLHRSNT